MSANVNDKCPECGGVYFSAGLEYEHRNLTCSFRWSEQYKKWVPQHANKRHVDKAWELERRRYENEYRED